MVLKFLKSREKYVKKLIKIGDNELNASISDNFIKRMVGLMYTESINTNECMLFIFTTESKYGIWMYKMNFPIDIIWLDKDKSIIDIKENIPACKSMFNCPVYYPKYKSKYIIELSAGYIKNYKIDKNTKIEF